MYDVIDADEDTEEFGCWSFTDEGEAIDFYFKLKSDGRKPELYEYGDDLQMREVFV